MFRPSNVSMTKQDWSAWAKLCKRYPNLRNQIDHAACLISSHVDGKINTRVHVQKTIGGWVSFVIGYAPFLENGHQRWCLNNDDQYPDRFTDIETATRLAIVESNILFETLTNFIKQGDKSETS